MSRCFLLLIVTLLKPPLLVPDKRPFDCSQPGLLVMLPGAACQIENDANNPIPSHPIPSQQC